MNLKFGVFFNGCYGVDLNAEETKVIRISKQSFPVQILVN